MAKAAPPEPTKVPTQRSTIITWQDTGAGFIVKAGRANDKPVTSITLTKHGGASFACSCGKSNPVSPMELSKADLGTLIQLLTQVRDEMVPGLEKYGVDE